MTWHYLGGAALTGIALLLGACTTPASTALPANVITVGGNAAQIDLDTCIDDSFTSMAGIWHMRFSVSHADGTVSHSDAKLAIRPIAVNRWKIQRPDASGTFRDFSTITNYGDGELESLAFNPDIGAIFAETYTACHAPDASGRFKYVSQMEQALPGSDTKMTITRTGWGTPNHHYSFDVMEAGEGVYALRTRTGERIGDQQASE